MKSIHEVDHSLFPLNTLKETVVRPLLILAGRCLGAGALTLGQAANACSCAPLLVDPVTHMEASETVVLGRVTGRTYVAADPSGRASPADYSLIKLTIQESFKGGTHETLVIQTIPDEGACGATVSQGATYLLYLHPIRSGRTHHFVSACDPPIPTRYAKTELAAIRAALSAAE